MGYSATTGPLPAITCPPDDWWDPGWQVAQSPGVTGLEPVICAAASPGAATAQPDAPAPPPSWVHVLWTTVSLWTSRHLPWLRRRLLAGCALAAGLLAMAVGTAGLILAAAPAAPLVPRPAPIPAPSGRAVLPASLASAPQAAQPVWLSVPAIGVRTRLVDLGLNENGTLQVPASTAVAGWFTGSPRPGAVGSAVIAGHVDSRSGPGIFFWLRSLRPGDRVYVGRADRAMAVFTITAVHMYAKDQFPTAAVYGPVPDAELRLITCGGIFDRSLGSYLSNVVVFARLTG
jgi:hypothetical protein